MADEKMKGRTPHGEKNSGAKLTAKDVMEIRLTYKPNIHTIERYRQKNILTRKELAVKFGVSISAITRLTNGHSWTHL